MLTRKTQQKSKNSLATCTSPDIFLVIIRMRFGGGNGDSLIGT